MSKKRFFPKNFKTSAPRVNSVKKLANRIDLSKTYNTGKNLRREFDIIMREKHKIVSDDQLYRFWQIIGTQLLEAPQKTLEELINSLNID